MKTKTDIMINYFKEGYYSFKQAKALLQANTGLTLNQTEVKNIKALVKANTGKDWK